MNGFIPDKITIAPREIPYFEDIRAANVAGRGTAKSIFRLQGEVIDLGIVSSERA